MAMQKPITACIECSVDLAPIFDATTKAAADQIDIFKSPDLTLQADHRLQIFAAR